MSKAVLISSMRTFTLYEHLVMAFSARSFTANISFVVLRPSLYAACVIGVLFFSSSYVLLIMHIASIFRSMLRRIIGLRFPGGPFFLFGLGSGISIPSFISFGYFPDLAVLLRMSAIA